jgi:hypothetical protein
MMTHNTDFFDQIEDYCLEQLEVDFKHEFEAELQRNPKLKNELNLWIEIQSALEEKEILTLRNKLEHIAKQNKTEITSNESFDLLSDFSDFQEINEILSSEELINFYDSLPRAHAYHHESTSNENIHQFYKKQIHPEVTDVEDELNDFDLEEFEGLEEAILEKDILQFRQKLNQVAKSLEPQFNIEEIDGFINEELSDSDLFDFENEMFQNRSFRDEVRLHQHIDKAIQENDIIDLRNKISNILRSETSLNVNEMNIEDFIDGILEGELHDEFMLELQDNTDLMAEVELRRQVNKAICETDIFDLRKELKAAKESSEVNSVKMLIPVSKTLHVKFWRRSVAILVVLLGLAGIIGSSLVSVNSTYDKYFESPAWSPERSLSSEKTLLQQANIPYLIGDYEQVIKILDQLPLANNENPVVDFYKGASLQNLGKYDDAILAYSKVLNHGDNLFLEEAEWYRCLCYLKMGNKVTARNELLAVLKRNGHFESDAKVLLRRLKYFMK